MWNTFISIYCLQSQKVNLRFSRFTWSPPWNFLSHRVIWTLLKSLIFIWTTCHTSRISSLNLFNFLCIFSLWVRLKILSTLLKYQVNLVEFSFVDCYQLSLDSRGLLSKFLNHSSNITISLSSANILFFFYVLHSLWASQDGYGLIPIL